MLGDGKLRIAGCRYWAPSSCGANDTISTGGFCSAYTGAGSPAATKLMLHGIFVSRPFSSPTSPNEVSMQIFCVFVKANRKTDLSIPNAAQNINQRLMNSLLLLPFSESFEAEKVP